MKKLLLCSVLVLLMGCGNNSSDVFSSSELNSETTSEVSSETRSEVSSENELSYIEINFDNHDRTAVDLKENNESMEYVKGLFADYLVSFECEKTYLDSIGNEYFLKVGSQNYSGFMNIEFSFTIKKVEINARSYSKYIEYNDLYSCDETSFYINDTDMKIENVKNGLTTYKNYSLDLNTNKLRIESRIKRTLIKSMKVYYF